MSSYHIYSLYSGSSGNATLICAAGRKILIDAGKSARALCSALCEVGFDICGIDAIFITHEHTDHISALEVISKKYKIPVHTTEGTARSMNLGAYLRNVLVTHPPLFTVDMNGIKISSFPTSHDCSCPVGYRIEFVDGDNACAIGIATDTGVVTPQMRESLYGCESVVLECNHDRKMLICGPYPETLKSRISSRWGHLSNDDSAEFACDICRHGTKNIMLAHLSKENNTPKYAFDTVYSAVAGLDVNIKVAQQDMPVMLN